jgi:hypothetical protein
VVSTRIPVRATMSTTMVTRMAMAVRPNCAEPADATEAAGATLGSADTVVSVRLKVMVELAGNP